MECPFFCVGADNMSTTNCANNCNVTLGHNMFFTLQTVCPTTIFHFQFSILHLIKTVFTNRERRLAV